MYMCIRRQSFMKWNLQKIALQTCTSLRLAPTFCQTWPYEMDENENTIPAIRLSCVDSVNVNVLWNGDYELWCCKPDVVRKKTCLETRYHGKGSMRSDVGSSNVDHTWWTNMTLRFHQMEYNSSRTIHEIIPRSWCFSVCMRGSRGETGSRRGVLTPLPPWKSQVAISFFINTYGFLRNTGSNPPWEAIGPLL